MTRPGARSLLPWLGLLVTLAFGYLAVRNVDAGDAWAAFRSSNPWWLVPSFAVGVVAVVIRSVRWRFLFAAPTRPPFGDVLRAQIVGLFFNNVLPARAGEAARVVALHRWSGNSPAEVAATVLVERVFDVLALVALLFAASPWLPDVGWRTGAAVLAGALAAACALVAVGVAVWRERPFRVLLRPLVLLPFFGEDRLAQAALNLLGGLAGVRRPRLALTAVFWTVLSWLVLGASTWLELRAFHLGLPLLAGLLTVIAINLALVLPAAPAAVGVFEAATIVALSAYGVPTSEALPAALVLHLLNVVPTVVAGVVVTPRTIRRRVPA